jgi:HSP20 family protein
MSALTPFKRFDDMFPELFRQFMRRSAFDLEPIEQMGDIRIDIDENDKSYAVRAELPGVKKEDVRVEVDGNRVSITAEVRKDVEEKGKEGRVLVRETYRGSASRQFTLAHDVDESGVVAKLEDGVLNLTLPKRSEGRSRTVAVQ